MRLSSALLLAPLALGCASVPRTPDWYADGPTCERPLSDGSRRYCATVLGRDLEEARASAVAAALGHAAAELRTEVNGSLEFDASCFTLDRNGVVTSTCTEESRHSLRTRTARLDVRGAVLERFRAARQGDGLRAFAVVKLSADEWARLSREALGRTLVAVDCGEAPKTCPAAILDALTSALSSCGVPGVAGMIAGESGLEALKRRAREVGAARALAISLRASDRGQTDGLAVAEAGGRWELVDSTDGRTLAAKGVPPRRVAERDDGSARTAALREAVRRLSSPSCGLSEAQGSLCCAGMAPVP